MLLTVMFAVYVFSYFIVIRYQPILPIPFRVITPLMWQPCVRLGVSKANVNNMGTESHESIDTSRPSDAYMRQ